MREEKEFAAAAFLLAPSEYVLNSFLRRGMAPEKLVRHRYGFDPLLFPEPQNEREDRPFTAVFVGRGDPTKGLHLALDAWLRSDAVRTGRFIVCGQLETRYEASLAHKLAHPSIARQGFVADVGSVLRKSDVLLLPSYTEGSALVTYEAQASGVVPLVSSSSGAYISHGAEGFIHEVADVAILTAQLNRLYSEPELLGKMRRAALKNSQNLTWRDAGCALVAAYHEGLLRKHH